MARARFVAPFIALGIEAVLQLTGAQNAIVAVGLCTIIVLLIVWGWVLPGVEHLRNKNRLPGWAARRPRLTVWGVALLSAVLLSTPLPWVWRSTRPALYRLVIEPSEFAIPSGTPNYGLAHIAVWVRNLTEPKAELHNIAGTVWLTRATIVKASRSPDRSILEGFKSYYYDFSAHVIHKSSGGIVMAWYIVPPVGDETFYLGFNVVSSETERQAGGWKIVRREDGAVRFIEDPKRPASDKR
jgi:hypothetical protein